MKIKKSEIKEIIRQALNEVSSSDIKELEAIVKELAGASKMHKSQSERIDKIVKSVSKTEEKLTETKGKWAVINANDVLNMFAEKVVDTQKEAEKIAKQMKQKDKYGKYQAVSVKKWNQAKPGNKIKEGKLTEKATGQYKVSPKVQMHWGMDKVVIISGNKRVVLNRKEMKSLMKGVKANKLTEGKLTNEAVNLSDASGEIFDSIIALKRQLDKSPHKKNRKINMYIKQLLKIEQQISDVIGDLD